LYSGGSGCDVVVVANGGCSGNTGVGCDGTGSGCGSNCGVVVVVMVVIVIVVVVKLVILTVSGCRL
jgi:hypothetical protein